MTTGRINQVTSWQGDPGRPRREAGESREPRPPRGQNVVKWKGRTRRPVAAAPPAYRGDAETIQLPPLNSSAPVRTQVIRPGAREGAGRLRHVALG
jgi:hypothetical protein